MLILINVYWMLSLAWQKHWMVKVLHSQISILPNFQLNLENLASLNACFPLFHAPFLNWPRSSSVFVTCEIIKYKGFHRYKSTSHCLDSIFIIPMQTEFLYLFSFSDIKAEWQIIQGRCCSFSFCFWQIYWSSWLWIIFFSLKISLSSRINIAQSKSLKSFTHQWIINLFVKKPIFNRCHVIWLCFFDFAGMY